MVAVWRQLQRFAAEFLRGHSLGLSIDGRLYLDWLLLRGAVRIVREGFAEDPAAMGEARNNIELLLASAAGMSLASGESEPLFSGLPRSGSRGRITALDLRRALRRLPPLWPLSKRGRDAKPA